MDVVQLLGRNVRRYRKLKGMTQEQLALEAGMERSYVSDLERGERNPSVKALGRLAAALSVAPMDLLDTAAESAPESRTPAF
jgi:transcriptional regulator with XRE-family HTH domain